jgi:hypothetical protein
VRPFAGRLSRRAGLVASRFVHHLLPPTLYFVITFNLISFSTNLAVRNSWFELHSIVLSTTTALVVAKVVLVVDRIRVIDRYRGAPLILPILYKSIFYSVVVLVVRFLEKVVDFAIEAHGFGDVFRTMMQEFSWHRFVAVQIWIFLCFLVYVSASELNALVGEGQLGRLFFRHRSAGHRLTRRQHIRALMELSRLAEHTPRERLLDPTSPQGARLVAIVDALRQKPATST